MSDAQGSIEGLPMVTEPTRAQSENAETVLTRLRSGRLIIPNYQRDAEQWDLRKESFFIESILNNLTIPAFFFSENTEKGIIEVVDGQQRLSTVLKYASDEFEISDDEGMVYLTPQSVHYRGKKFSDLPEQLQNVFNDYPLTAIYVPRNIELGAKLEIFRRINEGGTPLTAQDIRLAYYSESPSVTFIRLAGLHDRNPAADRMLSAAKEQEVENPWAPHSDSWDQWIEWWSGKVRARGQTPSGMFLWYLVTLHRSEMENLVASQAQMKHLPVSFRGSTEEALDIYCAQVRWTDENGGAAVFPTYGRGMKQEFANFVRWIELMLSRSLVGLSVDKYKQVALFIAAAVELELEPNSVSDDAWDAIAEFIRTPRHAGNRWLEEGYPEQKGRWGGSKGQKVQCDRVVELVHKIVERNP